MKARLCLSLLLLLSLVQAGACKGWLKGGDRKLVLTYKTDENATPMTKELVAKQSVMIVSEFTTTANGQAARIVEYRIYLANYDLDARALEREMPRADGQMGVEIQIAGAEGSTSHTPFKTGTYNASQFSDGINKFNKALDIRVNFFENGRLQDLSISIASPRKGFVKINSVDSDTVSGEVDMSDDFRAIKGEFSAVVVKP